MAEVLKIRIILDNTSPLIWRDILVKRNISFYQLHQIIQITMGWTNAHLFEFSIEGYRISEIYDDLEEFEPGDISNARELYLEDVINEKGEEFIYTYDFGDSWDHTIKVEPYHMIDKAMQLPVCLSGELQCPPEDCGGIPGFYNLLKILSNNKHPEYKDTKRWVGSKFDPTKFDLIKVNKQLKNINRSIREE